jgi:hypothetical protein
MTEKLLGLPKTADAHLWRQKWSTWLGWIAAGCVGAVGFYALAPDSMQATVPMWLLKAVMVLGMGSGFGVAVATSIQQAKK